MHAPPINNLMDATGMTCAQIATLMDVNPRTVRRWRSGESTAPLAAILVLSIIERHGMTTAATLCVPELENWITAMVMDLHREGHGLSGIQRKMGIGYGIIARTLDGRKMPR